MSVKGVVVDVGVMAMGCNQQSINEIMTDWNCTEIEAMVAVEYDCYTLEETRKEIQKSVTYNRLLVRLVSGVTEYIENRYKGFNVSNAFMQSRIQEFVEDEAEEIAYDNEILNDCEGIAEEEKRVVIY